MTLSHRTVVTVTTILFVALFVALPATALDVPGTPTGDPWASTAPLMGGESEVTGGLGLGVAAGFGPAPVPSVFPSLVVGARWGVTDDIQLAFPLIATLSSDVGQRGWPRLSLSAGLSGVGFSNIEGFIVVPMAGAAAHWSGAERAVVVGVDITSSSGTSALRFNNTTARAFAGMMVRLDDDWSVGFAASMSASSGTAADGFSRRVASARLGSSGGGVPADVPAVRWMLRPSLSLELWPFIDFASVAQDKGASTGFSDVGANLTVTFRP